jgi:5'-phosphate synthase pdxT subunit
VKAGVLALQGDFREHLGVLRGLGAAAIEVRSPGELADVACLVIPGGESTTIGKLALGHGLVEPIRERVAQGMPMLGTCAGLIVMAERVIGGEPLLGVLDVEVRRNAYGRQSESFEADLEVGGEPVRGVFIRAPVIESVGEGIEVLATHAGLPVVVAGGGLIGATFHPELAGDGRLHRRMLELV